MNIHPLKPDPRRTILEEMIAPRKVLIVDDDPIDREIFKRYLEAHEPGGYSFAESSLGKRAATQYRTFAPDCVLLDFKLPDIDGLTFLRSIQNDFGELDVAVVMLTALGNEHVAVEAMKLGVMDYLPKGPSTAEALARTINNAIEKFRMRREIAEQRIALEARNLELELIQKDLTEEKERYRVLTEVIPQLIWTANPDGRVEFANRHMSEYAGKDQLDWNFREIVRPEDRTRYQEAWDNANQTGTTFEIELDLVRAADRASRTHLVRAVPLRMPAREVGRWFGTCTDLHDQKKAEEALRQTQKLESIGLLAGGIAHDFNNILVGIMGAASFASDTMDRNHPAQEMLQMVVQSSERAAQLTQQLLAYAGKGETFLELIDMPRLVNETAELIRASIPRTTQLSVFAAEGSAPAVCANAAQIQQLIMNLLINAGEAIGEGSSGLITVRIGLQDLSPGDAPPNELGYAIVPGRYVTLEVTDTGCGMDDVTRSKIFDPFFTTKFAGRGLGLAATQGIVRALRGAITVSSSPGQGATFRVWLPAATAPAAVESPDTKVESAKRGCILVIDDESVVRRTAQAALSRNGHSVILAENGDHAVQLLTGNSPDVSLVLLDMNMPGETGVQVLKRLRRVHPEIPVVIMSGYGEREISEQFRDMTISGFIQKPFTARALGERVGGFLEAVEKRTALNRG